MKIDVYGNLSVVTPLSIRDVKISVGTECFVFRGLAAAFCFEQSVVFSSAYFVCLRIFVCNDI